MSFQNAAWPLGNALSSWKMKRLLSGATPMRLPLSAATRGGSPMAANNSPFRMHHARSFTRSSSMTIHPGQPRQTAKEIRWSLPISISAKRPTPGPPALLTVARLDRKIPKPLARYRQHDRATRRRGYPTHGEPQRGAPRSCSDARRIPMTCECGPSNDDAFEEEAAGLNLKLNRCDQAKLLRKSDF